MFSALGLSTPVLWVSLGIILINAAWSMTTGRQIVHCYVAGAGEGLSAKPIGKPRAPARWICFLASFVPGVLVAATTIIRILAKNADSTHCQASGCGMATNLLAVVAVSSLAWLVFWVDTQVLKIPNQVTLLLTLEILLFVLPATIWPKLGYITQVMPDNDFQNQVISNILVLCGGAILWVLILTTGGKHVGKGDLKLTPAMGALAATAGTKGIVSGIIVTVITGIVSLPLRLRAIPYGPPLVIGALFGALM